ncbi:MAG: hypothetical protein ACFC1C_01990 [Candidatus Malihini olakiniferum]
MKSGLRHAIEALDDLEEISFNFFPTEDIVGHSECCSRIVNTYKDYEEAEQKSCATQEAQPESEQPTVSNTDDKQES